MRQPKVETYRSVKVITKNRQVYNLHLADSKNNLFFQLLF